ncbi:MAG: HAD-IC family P-type ATPase, partial [Xenophilus sp.]
LRSRLPGGVVRALRLGAAGFCGVPRLAVPAVQVHLSDAEGWIASFVLEEDLRADAAQAVSALADEGVQVQLLSGDRDAAAHRLAAQAGIPTARGDCLPEDKLDALRRMQAGGRRVAMVGDGLNDGPVIAHADASFAFGRAVALTRAKADFIVLGDALSAIPATLAQARRTLKVVRQNLAWSAAYNALSVPLALAGWMPAWAAGLGMAASSLLVVINSARLARPAPLPAAADGRG